MIDRKEKDKFGTSPNICLLIVVISLGNCVVVIQNYVWSKLIFKIFLFSSVLFLTSNHVQTRCFWRYLQEGQG